MELKRYVMDSTNTIYDLETQHILGDGHKEGSGYLGCQLKVGSNFERTRYGEITKTSDNILGLVEVGDLVECTYHHELSEGGEWIEKPLYYIKGISETHFHLPVFSLEKTHKYITAIYKRQPNGDYKRYEVK